MAARPSNAFWNVIYALLIIAVILALLQLLGVFTLSSAIASALYTLVVVFVILAVLHLVGLI